MSSFQIKDMDPPRFLHLGAIWPFECAGHQTDGTHMEGSDAVGVWEAKVMVRLTLGKPVINGMIKYHLSEMKYMGMGQN